MTVAGICNNGTLGQSISSVDCSTEELEEFLRDLGYREFKAFENHEEYENAKLEAFKKVQHFIVSLSPQGSVERVYYDPDFVGSSTWLEEFTGYEEFNEFISMDSYDRVLRKAESDEGREFLKTIGWHFVDGGHYPF